MAKKSTKKTTKAAVKKKGGRRPGQKSPFDKGTRYVARHKAVIERETVKKKNHTLQGGTVFETTKSPLVEMFPGITRNQRLFLSAYTECGTLTKAAECTGLHIGNHYDWLKYSEAYRQAWEYAQEQAVEILEAEAMRRAVEGVRRYKFFKGKPIKDPKTKEPYYEMEYSDTLLILLLKAARPQKYRENFSVQSETTVKGQMDTRIDARVLLQQLPVDLRKQLFDHLQTMKTPAPDGPPLLPSPDSGMEDGGDEEE